MLTEAIDNRQDAGPETGNDAHNINVALLRAKREVNWLGRRKLCEAQEKEDESDQSELHVGAGRCRVLAASSLRTWGVEARPLDPIKCHDLHAGTEPQMDRNGPGQGTFVIVLQRHFVRTAQSPHRAPASLKSKTKAHLYLLDVARSPQLSAPSCRTKQTGTVLCYFLSADQFSPEAVGDEARIWHRARFSKLSGLVWRLFATQERTASVF